MAGERDCPHPFCLKYVGVFSFSLPFQEQPFAATQAEM